MGKTLLTTLFAFALSAYAAAQESPPPRGSDDDELTPQKTLERLAEAQDLMRKAEEHLNDLLVDKSEQRQKAVIELLDQVLKSARSAAGSPSSKQDPAKGDGKSDGASKGGSTPAGQPYDPGRTGDVSRFHSTPARNGSWGTLPPAARAAILDSAKSEVPPEFQDAWKAYSEEIQKSAGK